MSKTKEQIVVDRICEFLKNAICCDVDLAQADGQDLFYVRNPKFDMFINTCNFENRDYVKIEYLQFKDKDYTFATRLVELLCDIAKIEGVSLGIWCDKDDKKSLKLYTNGGFKIIKLFNDDSYWLASNLR